MVADPDGVDPDPTFKKTSNEDSTVKKIQIGSDHQEKPEPDSALEINSGKNLS